MKAAVVTSLSAPLEVVERAVPDPGTGEVLLQLQACGLCRADVDATRGELPGAPAVPFVPGHEGVGVVVARGTGVRTPRVGDRVALVRRGSRTVAGALAEYAVARADQVVAVPEGISAVDAAPLTCGGVRAWAAVRVARLLPAERVGVFGVGGAGHLALQYARIQGATVVAVDVARAPLDLATALGAQHVVNAGTTEPVAAVQALGGLDVALVLTAAPHVHEEALAVLRPGGRLVTAAQRHDEATMAVPIGRTVTDALTVLGAPRGTREDLAEVLALHAAGRARVVTESWRLEGVNEALTKVLAEHVATRVVIDCADGSTARTTPP
ncbi:alcohol dehydrogenase catalytic domain-containing protein [Nocardioides rubriscoriae]|uniref:alcohol dehydrogenase catalytic domain-containing protein n=1 Tax=Nocardioides rubriscoriae TaxID=642762 RepID=UPI0011DF6A4C|nr:zinc-binding dehydrogenase [Nocardioides rubriscoriae]